MFTEVNHQSCFQACTFLLGGQTALGFKSPIETNACLTVVGEQLVTSGAESVTLTRGAPLQAGDSFRLLGRGSRAWWDIR